MGFRIVERLFAVGIPDGCIEVGEGLVERSLRKVSFATIEIGQEVLLDIVMATLFMFIDEARKGLDSFRIESVQLLKLRLEEQAPQFNEVSGD